MDYLTLFKNTDRLDGGDFFRFLHYRCGGPKSLECGCRFPMLFVLQGSLKMHFKYSGCIVDAGNIIVIDTEMLTEFHAAEYTVVLVYMPPERLSYFFSQSSQIFDTCFSQIVPILPPLQEWIDHLLEQCSQEVSWTNEGTHVLCRELATILIAYSRRDLGELYAPFTVCARGNCERCRETVG